MLALHNLILYWALATGQRVFALYVMSIFLADIDIKCVGEGISE